MRDAFRRDDCVEARADAMAVHHNRTGYRGVVWRKDKQKFQVRFGSERRSLGYFDDAKDAAVAYDEAARERYGDHAYLNFPLLGENQVRRGDGEFFCPKGHAYSEHGYHAPNGRTNCRKCNAAAAARCKQRKGLRHA
jgi:hypothetical protein